MAFIWLDAEGNGRTVAETASVVKHRLEDEETGSFVPLTVETEDGEEEPWRRIYIDVDSVVAIEQGAGVVDEDE